MAVQPNVIAAGLKDGKIKTSDGSLYDIHAIVEANGEPQQDEIEVKGDDQLLGTFISNKREELTVKANALPFEVIQAITGNTVSSSPTGMEVAMGTESETNPPEVEIQAFSNALDTDNTALTLKKTWHKVTVKSVLLSQAGEQEFNIEMTCVAYQTDEDIEGSALSTKRIATIEVYS
jgi:hypothetical protein